MDVDVTIAEPAEENIEVEDDPQSEADNDKENEDDEGTKEESDIIQDSEDEDTGSIKSRSERYS